VVDDTGFWEAHRGLSLGSPGNPKIDAVTGSTLTSSAISRSIIERLGGLTTSRLFPTEILAAELPEAASIEEHPDWPGVFRMYDKNRNIVGHALRTAPSQEYLHGYQGPTDVLIVLDREAKKVTRIRFRKSYDNEDYYERILDDPDWLDLYDGLSIEEILAIDQSKIEGVSGATHTSWAIADSVARRLARFESDREPQSRKIPWRNIALVALTGGAAIFSFTSLRGNPIARIRLAGDCRDLPWDYSRRSSFPSPPSRLGTSRTSLLADSWGLLFLAAAALLTPWATGNQLYCHQLCPHGFLQQWLGKLPVKPVKIPPKLNKFLSRLPALLLIILVASTIVGASWNLANWEGFDAWLWRSAGIATITIAASLVLLHPSSALGLLQIWLSHRGSLQVPPQIFRSKTASAFAISLPGLLCLAAFLA
jgi:NosR/NirI family nitrous oxide reductase transcriptional regulator